VLSACPLRHPKLASKVRKGFQFGRFRCVLIAKGGRFHKLIDHNRSHPGTRRAFLNDRLLMSPKNPCVIGPTMIRVAPVAGRSFAFGSMDTFTLRLQM